VKIYVDMDGESAAAAAESDALMAANRERGDSGDKDRLRFPPFVALN